MTRLPLQESKDLWDPLGFSDSGSGEGCKGVQV
jgi:hypothetical protein